VKKIPSRFCCFREGGSISSLSIHWPWRRYSAVEAWVVDFGTSDAALDNTQPDTPPGVGESLLTSFPLDYSQLTNRLRWSGVGTRQFVRPFMSLRRLFAIRLYMALSSGDGHREAIRPSSDHHPPR